MSHRSARDACVSMVLVLLTALAQNGVYAATSKSHVGASGIQASDGPSYTADGQLRFPAKYREWIFLTSGLDMSYNPAAGAVSKSVFDNVFVNPSAYRVFVKTGTWPNKTMLVLENRGGAGNQSINTRGKTQTEDITGLEVHVKDLSQKDGGWAFYSFDNPVSAKKIARPASCYTCHEAHGAVDTTFVQFYPTLLPIATKDATLSPRYRAEINASAKPHAH